MIWKKISLISLLLMLLAQTSYGATENLSTYTEFDEDNKVVIDANNCTFTSASTRQKTYYVYKDYTAGHFANYTHNAIIQSVTKTNLQFPVFWGVTNTGGADRVTWANGQEIYSYTSTGYMSYRDIASVGSDATTVDISSTTKYYTVTRNGTTGQCKIYNDSGRTDLLDTLAVTTNTTAYQYLYVFSGYDTNHAEAGLATGYTKFLDLNEGATPEVIDYSQVIMVN